MLCSSVVTLKFGKLMTGKFWNKLLEGHINIKNTRELHNNIPVHCLPAAKDCNGGAWEGPEPGRPQEIITRTLIGHWWHFVGVICNLVLCAVNNMVGRID